MEANEDVVSVFLLSCFHFCACSKKISRCEAQTDLYSSAVGTQARGILIVLHRKQVALVGVPSRSNDGAKPIKPAQFAGSLGKVQAG